MNIFLSVMVLGDKQGLNDLEKWVHPAKIKKMFHLQDLIHNSYATSTEALLLRISRCGFPNTEGDELTQGGGQVWDWLASLEWFAF